MPTGKSKLTIATSVAATALLGLAGSASAATLTGNLQLTGGVEIPNETTILFSPDPDNVPASAPVGDSAITTIETSANSGSFALYNLPNNDPPGVLNAYQGLVQSIDVALGLPVENFLVLPAVTEGTLSIAETTIRLDDFAALDLGIVNGFQQFSFSGNGTALNEGDVSLVAFDFTAQGDATAFVPSGFDGGPGSLDPDEVADIQFSYSGTANFTPPGQDVPEPATTAGLLAFGALAATKMKRNKAAKA